MDQSSPDNGLETEEEDSKVADAGNKVFEGSERRRMESIGEDQDEEAQSYMSERSGYLHIPYGFQSRGSYKHASKNCEIVGGRITFFIIIFIYLFILAFITIQLLITTFTLHWKMFIGKINETTRNAILKTSNKHIGPIGHFTVVSA